jgi:hypothetical protein
MEIYDSFSAFKPEGQSLVVVTLDDPRFSGEQ